MGQTTELKIRVSDVVSQVHAIVERDGTFFYSFTVMGNLLKY